MEGAKFIVSSIATTSGTKEYFDFIYPFSLDSRLTAELSCAAGLPETSR
jgi:hypothetical protein